MTAVNSVTIINDLHSCYTIAKVNAMISGTFFLNYSIGIGKQLIYIYIYIYIYIHIYIYIYIKYIRLTLQIFLN